MAETIRFTVRGIPVPKARARTVIQGGRAHSYTPDKTRQWERTVQWYAARHRPATPLRGPLAVALTFYLPRPRRCKRDFPSVRPDLDNYVKAVLDPLNGLMWVDDGQIVELQAEKRYGEPRVTVEIREVEEVESL